MLSMYLSICLSVYIYGSLDFSLVRLDLDLDVGQ